MDINDKFFENFKTILDRLTLEELLCQLAEECGELAQAALKLRRALDGKNPTPRTEQECIENLAEEHADVELVFALIRSVLTGSEMSEFNAFDIQVRKAARWASRLAAREVTT